MRRSGSLWMREKNKWKNRDKRKTNRAKVIPFAIFYGNCESLRRGTQCALRCGKKRKRNRGRWSGLGVTALAGNFARPQQLCKRKLNPCKWKRGSEKRTLRPRVWKDFGSVGTGECDGLCSARRKKFVFYLVQQTCCRGEKKAVKLTALGARLGDRARRIPGAGWLKKQVANEKEETIERNIHS